MEALASRPTTTNGHAAAAPSGARPPTSETTRQALQEHIDDTGRSIRSVARAMGRGASTVSQFLGDKYRGDVAKLAEDVRSYLRGEVERARRQQEGALLTGEGSRVETQAYQRLHHIARLVHLDRDIGVCCAEPGSGKTVAAEAYAEEHTGVIFVETDPSFTSKAVAREIARALSLDDQGTLYALTRRIYDRLEGSGRLLIVDEAESLMLRSLELLRRIHDRTGCGLLLVGTERLLENLQGAERELKQLWSRVGLKAKLAAALTAEDTEQVVRAALPGLDAGEAEEVAQAAREAGAASARMTGKLLRRAASVAQMNGRAVTPAIVEKAASLLIL